MQRISHALSNLRLPEQNWLHMYQIRLVCAENISEEDPVGARGCFSVYPQNKIFVRVATKDETGDIFIIVGTAPESGSYVHYYCSIPRCFRLFSLQTAVKSSFVFGYTPRPKYRGDENARSAHVASLQLRISRLYDFTVLSAGIPRRTSTERTSVNWSLDSINIYENVIFIRGRQRQLYTRSVLFVRLLPCFVSLSLLLALSLSRFVSPPSRTDRPPSNPSKKTTGDLSGRDRARTAISALIVHQPAVAGCGERDLGPSLSFLSRSSRVFVYTSLCCITVYYHGAI